jgi:hypothetical protein
MISKRALMQRYAFGGNILAFVSCLLIVAEDRGFNL